MAVHEHRADLLYEFGKRRLRRWLSGASGGWSERHVTLGWLPDGPWWVEDTAERDAWVYIGDTSAEARAAAEEKIAELLAGGAWEPVIAEFVPGVMPARAAEVPEWPPGHEPTAS